MCARVCVTHYSSQVTAFDTICTAFATDLITSFEALLSPCIFGLVATLWAWFNSFGLCCAEGCCCRPKQGGADGGGVKVVSLGVSP